MGKNYLKFVVYPKMSKLSQKMSANNACYSTALHTHVSMTWYNNSWQACDTCGEIWKVTFKVTCAHYRVLKKYMRHFVNIVFYWHERAAFQRSAFGRSTAGNDIVATVSIPLFSPRFFFPSVATFSHRRMLGSINLFSESCLEYPKT